VDIRIKSLVDILAKRDMAPYKTHKIFAKEHFMPIHDEYYLRYVALQRKGIKEIAYSQNYIYVKINVSDRDYNSKYYVVGVDTESDKLFINRVNYTNIEGYLINVDDIKGDLLIMRVKESLFKERIFEYTKDILDDEYIVDIGPYEFMTYRVQGDLQIGVHKYPNDFSVLGAIDRQVMEYREYLIADKIAALLNDYGISYNVRRAEGGHYEIVIPGGTDSSRWSKYSRRNRLRIVKLLSQYFTIESPSDVVDGGFTTTVKMWDGDTQFTVEIISRAYFNEWVGDAIIRTQGEFSYEKRRMLVDDVIKQLDKLEQLDLTRQIGNHRITLKKVIPVSIAYTPQIKPIVLDPLTLYIVVPNTYIVNSDSEIEFSHKEHGVRKVKFADKYIVRITHNDVHAHDAAQRNRVALSRIPTYKP
jgi:hypothetical protein